jgi:hypothetical protein
MNLYVKKIFYKKGGIKLQRVIYFTALQLCWFFQLARVLMDLHTKVP